MERGRHVRSGWCTGETREGGMFVIVCDEFQITIISGDSVMVYAGSGVLDTKNLLIVRHAYVGASAALEHSHFDAYRCCICTHISFIHREFRFSHSCLLSIFELCMACHPTCNSIRVPYSGPVFASSHISQCSGEEQAISAGTTCSHATAKHCKWQIAPFKQEKFRSLWYRDARCLTRP